jgi:protease I
VATDALEHSELMLPQEKLADAGATVGVAAPKSPRMKSDRIYGWNKSDLGKTVTALQGV